MFLTRVATLCRVVRLSETLSHSIACSWPSGSGRYCEERWWTMATITNCRLVVFHCLDWGTCTKEQTSVRKGYVAFEILWQRIFPGPLKRLDSDCLQCRHHLRRTDTCISIFSYVYCNVFLTPDGQDWSYYHSSRLSNCLVFQIRVLQPSTSL